MLMRTASNVLISPLSLYAVVFARMTSYAVRVSYCSLSTPCLLLLVQILDVRFMHVSLAWFCCAFPLHFCVVHVITLWSLHVLLLLLTILKIM